VAYQAVLEWHRGRHRIRDARALESPEWGGEYEDFLAVVSRGVRMLMPLNDCASQRLHAAKERAEDEDYIRCAEHDVKV